jgi:hypothetical protein
MFFFFKLEQHRHHQQLNRLVLEKLAAAVQHSANPNLRVVREWAVPGDIEIEGVDDVSALCRHLGANPLLRRRSSDAVCASRLTPVNILKHTIPKEE